MNPVPPAFDNVEDPTLVDLRAPSCTVPEMAAMLIEPRSFSLAGRSGGEPVQGSTVSGTFSSVLRVRRAFGRFFAAAGLRLVAASLAGSWAPSRGASAIEPMASLRAE